jgi:hypothetical protein
LIKDDLSADQRAALAHAKSALVESAATEVVSIGRALFKDGEPSDPELQRRYRLYKRLEAALALPAGPQQLCIRRTASSGQISRARPETTRLSVRLRAPSRCSPDQRLCNAVSSDVTSFSRQQDPR